MAGFRKLDEEIVATGNVISFAIARFETPTGDVVRRELVHHPGAVAVVPLDGDEVVLVRQYRAPFEADLLEIPAGKRDVAGEDPRLTATRELAEEVGLAAGSLQLLAEVAPTPGFCDETIHLFLATELHDVPAARHGPEEEAMTVVRLPLAEAISAVLADPRADAKTLIGLLLAERASRP